MLGTQWLALADSALAPVNVHGPQASIRGRAYGPFVWYEDGSGSTPPRVSQVTATGLAQAQAAVRSLVPPTPEQVRSHRARPPRLDEPNPVGDYTSAVLGALWYDVADLAGDPEGVVAAYAVSLLEELGAPPAAVEGLLAAWTPAAAAVVAATALTATAPGGQFSPLYLKGHAWRRIFFGDAREIAMGASAAPPLAPWAHDPAARAAFEGRVASTPWYDPRHEQL